MMIVARIDYHRWVPCARPGLPGGDWPLSVAVMSGGRRVQWVQKMAVFRDPVSFQPSEFAKVADHLVLGLPGHENMQRKMGKLTTHHKGAAPGPPRRRDWWEPATSAQPSSSWALRRC